MQELRDQSVENESKYMKIWNSVKVTFQISRGRLNYSINGIVFIALCLEENKVRMCTSQYSTNSFEVVQTFKCKILKP